MVARYRVAHELRRTQSELDDMTVSEFNHWVAYFVALDNAES